jgi:ATP-dependent Clp protease ATP-binding subunit ClpC
MFELFTHNARRLVVLADHDARMLNHNYIGTEHLLLALCYQGESVAEQTLVSLSISLDQVRSRVLDVIGQGERQPVGHIPFTQPLKDALELSLYESERFGHDYIGPEHLLLGLIGEGDGIAATVLLEFGADLDRVREQVFRLLHG